MKLLNVIQELSKEGYQIEYRKRSDGGVLITSINGKRFRGSDGNNIARQIAGKQLSGAQTTANLKNVTKYIRKTDFKKKHKVKFKRTQIAETDKKLIRMIQKLARKSNGAGSTSRDMFRKMVKKFGLEEARQKLNEQLRHLQGFAYEGVVDAITDRISRLKLYFEGKGNEKLIDGLLEKIKDYKTEIREEYVNAFYRVIYKAEQTHSKSDLLEAIRYIDKNITNRDINI